MKTAEQVLQEATLLTKGTRLNKDGAEYKIMIKAMDEYAEQKNKEILDILEETGLIFSVEILKRKYMNREIKFRAWHSEFGEMVYSSDEYLYEKREFYPFCIPVGFSHYPTGLWEIMQYTGIKDKTGKDIYEGDIVYRQSTSTTGDVRFRKGKFYVRWKGEAGYVMFDSDIETCEESDEIKGNIFENPDVCDGKN